MKVVQSCLTLCDPMDGSPPGSSAHGILQARILEWVTISSSRASSDPEIEPRALALQANYLPSQPPGKPPDCGRSNLYVCVCVCVCVCVIKNLIT